MNSFQVKPRNNITWDADDVVVTRCYISQSLQLVPVSVVLPVPSRMFHHIGREEKNYRRGRRVLGGDRELRRVVALTFDRRQVVVLHRVDLNVVVCWTVAFSMDTHDSCP